LIVEGLITSRAAISRPECPSAASLEYLELPRCERLRPSQLPPASRPGNLPSSEPMPARETQRLLRQLVVLT